MTGNVGDIGSSSPPQLPPITALFPTPQASSHPALSPTYSVEDPRHPTSPPPSMGPLPSLASVLGHPPYPHAHSHSPTASQTQSPYPAPVKTASVAWPRQNGSSSPTEQNVDSPTTDDPADQLLEKRRRNAHASARFRDRRRAREREMTDRCSMLERRVIDLEQEARQAGAWRAESLRWRDECARAWERTRVAEAEVMEWRRRSSYPHPPPPSS